MSIEVIGWLGGIAALSGAAMLVLNARRIQRVFGVFLVSSTLLTVYAWLAGTMPFVALHVLMAIVNVIGIVRAWPGRRRSGVLSAWQARAPRVGFRTSK